jgi:hypothetical protein
MTLFAHAALSAAITYQISDNIPLTIVSAIVGTLNDVSRVLLREKDWNGSYASLHNPFKAIKNKTHRYITLFIMTLFYPMGIHALVDYYWHKPSGGWYPWGVRAEIAIFWPFFVFWLLYIAV